MLKNLLIVFALISSFTVSAGDFTVDHFEASWSGSSRSEDIPEYCKFKGDRLNNDGEVSFKLEFEYSGDPLTSFNASAIELTGQLKKQGSFILLKNATEQVQVNVAGYEILNFTYMKIDSKGKVVRQFVCSNR